MTLPNLLVIGARKAGTTSLHDQLAQHPDVFMSSPRELHFFDDETRWARGVDWYASFFEAGRDFAVRGEKTPMYASYPHRLHIPARVKSVLPDVRLVYVLRDPIARIRSQYVGGVVHGHKSLPIEQEVLSRAVYTDLSRYSMQVEQWLKHFDRDQLLLVTSESLWNRHEETMRQVFTFLEVDPSFVPQPQPANVTQGKAVRLPPQSRRRRIGRAVRRLPEPLRTPLLNARRQLATPAEAVPAEMTPELRSALRAVLRDDVTRLRRYLPPDFDGWGIDTA